MHIESIAQNSKFIKSIKHAYSNNKILINRSNVLRKIQIYI